MEIDKISGQNVSQQVRLYAQGVQPTEAKKGSSAAKPPETGQGDNVVLSESARELQWAKKLVSEASDVREDVVAKIKGEIEAGIYPVSDDAIVDKLAELLHGE